MPPLESNIGAIRKEAIIIALLLSVVGLFELLPVVDRARGVFPSDWHRGMDCYDALAMRPWYGQINPWFWFWFFFTPIFTFSAKPSTPAQQKALRTIFIISVSYVVIILAGYLWKDIRNAPFLDGFDFSDATERDRFKLHCFDVGADGYYVFATLFGWIPALTYAGWWEIIWYQYHKRKTKLIDGSFRWDWISKIIVLSAAGLPLLIVLWTIWVAVYKRYV